MKDILEPLKKAIEEASGYGQNVVIFPLIDARILVEDIKLILSDAISHPHWDKNGYLDGGTIYKDCVPVGHIDPRGEPGEPGTSGTPAYLAEYMAEEQKLMYEIFQNKLTFNEVIERCSKLWELIPNGDVDLNPILDNLIKVKFGNDPENWIKYKKTYPIKVGDIDDSDEANVVSYVQMVADNIKRSSTVEEKRERGANVHPTCRLEYAHLSDCSKWMEDKDGCLHCDHHGYRDEFD